MKHFPLMSFILASQSIFLNKPVTSERGLDLKMLLIFSQEHNSALVLFKTVKYHVLVDKKKMYSENHNHQKKKCVSVRIFYEIRNIKFCD